MGIKTAVKIGILGSACNPPHTGHVAIGECAKKTLKLDRLIIMPTKHSPHKEVPGVSGKMRFAMARLMAKKRGWEVSDMEMRRRGKSYTADTIAELKKKYPHVNLFWIVGLDAILSMPKKWKLGYGILDHCQFVAAKRRGYPLKRVPADILKKIIVLQKPARQSFSSTAIRNAIARGDLKKAKQYLDPEVFAFIICYNLYQS